jgi:hypothetical protein
MGRTVQIYMMDGSFLGIRHVEIRNRTIQALAVSHARFPELKEKVLGKRPAFEERTEEWITQAAGAGVYFLFTNRDSSESKPKVYIGQSQQVLQRIAQHYASEREFNELIIFVTKDKYINANYLEAVLIEKSNSIGRYEVEQNNQRKPLLAQPDRDAMGEIIEDIKLLLGVLGHPILEPIRAPLIDGPQDGIPEQPARGVLGQELIFGGNGFSARGGVTDEGFSILAGSTARINETAAINEGYKKLRQKLKEDRILEEVNGGLKFREDYTANSSSQAAAIVSGHNRQGPICWKRRSDSKTLKELEAEAVDVQVTPTPREDETYKDDF